MCRWDERKGFSIITEFMTRRKDPVYRELLALEQIRSMESAVSLPFPCSHFFLFFSQSNTRTLSFFLSPSLLSSIFDSATFLRTSASIQKCMCNALRSVNITVKRQCEKDFTRLFSHAIERYINFIMLLHMRINIYYLKIKFLICAK